MRSIEKLNIRRLFMSGLVSLCLVGLLFISCNGNSKSESLTVEITNSSNVSKTDILVELSNKEFIEKLNEFNVKAIAVKLEDKVVPHQLEFNQYNQLINSLLINLDVPANESIKIIVNEDLNVAHDFVKRTQAEISVKEGGKWHPVIKKNGAKQFEYQGGEFKNIESLRVPDKHTDHTYYIRYEGPGWESDKVGYRFYLDWRNAVDIFGKRTNEMVLQDVGLDGFDSYHEDADWGMDVLKVGKSLGLGSIAYWNGDKAIRVENTDSVSCEIRQNGNLRSEIVTNYYGWKDCNQHTNLESIISIDAGSRLTNQLIYTKAEVQNICTGIVNHGVGFYQSKNEESEWSYIATYGNQSLNDDKLGMFVFYKTETLIQLVEDEYSYALVLKPQNNKVEYYFGATWEQELDAVSNEEEFVNYLEQTLEKINNPVNKKY